MSEQMEAELTAAQILELEQAFRDFLTAASTKLPDVHFGTRDDDVMPHSWAERALTWLHKNNPSVFGDMMLATMNVDAHTTKTRGK